MDKRDTSDLILGPRGVHRWEPSAQPTHWIARVSINLRVLCLRAQCELPGVYMRLM